MLDIDSTVNNDGGVTDVLQIDWQLPKTDKLKIPIEKLTKYALNSLYDLNKSTAFELALGFTAKDIGLLMRKIEVGATHFTATPKLKDKWGQRYEVIMRMAGYAGKQANVLTAWIEDEAANEMRLVSIYITDKEVSPNDTTKTV
jgi:hypothetical protein